MLACNNSARLLSHQVVHPTTPRAHQPTLRIEVAELCQWTYPPAQDLVDGSAFLQCALSHHLGSHFLHVEHEGIQRFLYVDLFLFLLFLFSV